MTVFIDPPVWPAHGTLFSHLVSDHDYGELHELAARAGVSRRAFDGDHYDVPAARHSDLVRAGAVPTSAADLVGRLNASGLRLRKRKGEHGVARLFDQWTPFGAATLDVVRSGRPAEGATAMAPLQASDDPWGVPLRMLGASGQVRAGGLTITGEPIGWVRVHAATTRQMVQVVLGHGRPPVSSPWTLLL